MSIVRSLIGVLWLAFWTYWLVSASTAKKTLRTNALWIGIAARLAIVFLVVWLLRHHNLRIQVPASDPLVAAAGLLACVAGLTLAVWARVYLGRNWGMPMSQKEEPELVTSGPYAYIRHPIYSGVLIAIVGTAVTDGSWWLIAFFIAGVYFLFSAKREEQIMTDAFPSQYPDYKRRTKMLIPFVL